MLCALSDDQTGGDTSGDLSDDLSGICPLEQQHVHGRHNLAAGVGRTGAAAALGEVRSTIAGGARSRCQLRRGKYPKIIILPLSLTPIPNACGNSRNAL